MAEGTIILTQDFPSVPFNQEPPSFEAQVEPPSGNVLEDVQNALPPHITKLFQDLAMQTKYDPCSVMEEAQDILGGLQEGRLQYQGINQESFFIELLDTEDSSIRSFHGPHVAALMQYYGAEAIYDESYVTDENYSNILLDALGGNREAYEHAIMNVGMSMSVEAVQQVIPGHSDNFPGIPKIQNCFSS